MIDFEKRLNAIEQRNEKIELDQVWKTSWSRKIILAVLTYPTIVLFFFVAELPKPFINSILPTLGFVLSTMTFPFFKRLWIKYGVKK